MIWLESGPSSDFVFCNKWSIKNWNKENGCHSQFNSKCGARFFITRYFNTSFCFITEISKKMFLPFLIIFARSFFGLFLLLQLIWIITVLVRNSGLWNRKGRSENIHTLREKMLLVNQSVSILEHFFFGHPNPNHGDSWSAFFILG